MKNFKKTMIKELRQMTRKEQLGVLADGMELKSKIICDLVTSVMAEKQNTHTIDKRKPMLSKRSA